jgi:hypothetical protein
VHTMEGKFSDTQLCKSLRAPEGQIKGCPPSLLRGYLLISHFFLVLTRS